MKSYEYLSHLSKQELRLAIQFNKESLFSKIIDDSDVSSCCTALESYDSDSLLSPFESACRDANRGHFIRECISIGCDGNKVMLCSHEA